MTINAGSSSIKFALLASNATRDSFEPLLSVVATNLDQSSARLSIIQPQEEEDIRTLNTSNLSAVIETMVSAVTDHLAGDPITAIGHRIVHGGPRYNQPQPVTDALERELQSLSAFDPEHAPLELELIRTLQKRLPNIPQIACFDTSFFHELPPVAQLMALPRKYQAQGLRRYGFHGLSYTYLLSAFHTIAGETAANGKVIFAHLGSGASLAATSNGKPVDTTMGFTPASGIMMSTRSGDIDPGVARYLHQQAGMNFDEYNHMVNFESGLLGVSALSADMLTLLNNEANDPHAAEAVALFCYQAQKAIGGLVASLGGLNSLVFSGGIGEQSAPIRARICAGLRFLGIELDDERNARHEECISAQGSPIGVHVIATDEAQTICQQTIGFIARDTPAGEYS